MQTFSHYPSIPPPRRVPLITFDEKVCPYLAGRGARNRAFWAESIPPQLYHDFMDAGFRRSGKVIYQPVCPGCRACVPLRIPTATFVPSKSQRRCSRRNSDLEITFEPAEYRSEDFALYERYLKHRHHVPGVPHVGAADDGVTAEETQTPDDYERFLCDSPVNTLAFRYRRPCDGRLLAVGICDVSPRSLSSVYFYFEPSESRRGLGTYGVVAEIEWARKRAIEFYYLGYRVEGCAAMEYKSRFGPAELLQTDGEWRSHDARTHRRVCIT